MPDIKIPVKDRMDFYTKYKQTYPDSTYQEAKSIGGYGTTTDGHNIYYYFDDKSGKRNWLEKEDYDRKILH